MLGSRVKETSKIWLSLRMFLIQPMYFQKLLGKPQPQHSYKQSSFKAKSVHSLGTIEYDCEYDCAVS